LTSDSDNRIRVLPLHVANKIAAGEVVERPASVVKELIENALDAGARKIAVSIARGGRQLVDVQDDGCGMSRADATLCLERQATSKIRDVDDIVSISTLGFRGEAIPSIASVSRLTLTTRRHDSDEGTLVQVNAGTLVDVRAAGCPPGTRVEVRDLFCNVPARRKFLRTAQTEENHIRHIFTVHALAHPAVAFVLTVDGRELCRLAPATDAAERVREIFGSDTAESLLPLPPPDASAPEAVTITGFIERPNLAVPTRREQYIFVNGRPASAPVIAAALREACPRRQGDVRPAAVLFITVPPSDVDVNVHPTKREVRFRNAGALKRAVVETVSRTLTFRGTPDVPASAPVDAARPGPAAPATERTRTAAPETTAPVSAAVPPPTVFLARTPPPAAPRPQPVPVPVETELPLAADNTTAKPWAWFRFLAVTASGYLLIETDAGVVTINPHAARERIAFEQLRLPGVSQALLIPETIRLSPTDFARLDAARPAVEAMGFRIEPFGRDTFKIDAVPQLIDGLPPATVLSTIARDLSDAAGRRSGEQWRDELIARSVARSYAGMSLALTPDGAVRLVEELAACHMPYVCPRGKPIMIFTSTRELNRKFSRE
jgi:DNA mismatch repair protein MutL